MKTKYPRVQALVVAAELCAYLKPFCMPDRLKVCGSIRRRKESVSDIEVLYIGKIEERQEGLFDTKPFNLAEEAIGRLLLNGVLEKRHNVRGAFTWGELNKLAVHCKSGIPVDLFATVPGHWWGSVVVRTGSKEFNLRIIESAAKKGLDLHAYGPCDFTHSSTMAEISCASEEQFFQMAGMPWLEPHQRI